MTYVVVEIAGTFMQQLPYTDKGLWARRSLEHLGSQRISVPVQQGLHQTTCSGLVIAFIVCIHHILMHV